MQNNITISSIDLSNELFSISTTTNLKQCFEDFIRFCDTTSNTIKTYKKSLKVFFDYLSTNDITKPTRETIILFKKYQEEKGLQATTIASYLTALRQFFIWTEEKRIYKNITTHIKGAKVDSGSNYKKDALTQEQAIQVLKQAQLSSNSELERKRNFALLHLAFSTGARTIEIARADIKDIVIKEGKAQLNIQGKGRHDKDNFFDLSTQTYDAIKEYLALRNNLNTLSPLFASASDRNNGQRLTTTSISRIIKSAFRAIGLDANNLTAHSTRHTFATMLYKKGYALEDIQLLMRHKDIKTTMRYTHTAKKHELQGEQAIADALSF